jgi:uncharacterized protein (TIGR03000 family)
MSCQLRWVGLGFVCVVGLLTASAGLGQPPAAREDKKDDKTATILVRLPDAKVKLTVDGSPLTQTGKERKFVTPPLVPGKRYSYTFVATVELNEYTWALRTHVVKFKAGETVTADLRTPQTGQRDKVLVGYGETPPKVVEAMCKLAKIGKDDVVYDLGCGDGRMVINAVKKYGAKKGVGIDIDPVRVKQAKEKVKAAGLSDKIEIRQGDVLELTDLSEASVVMLYIGEELNVRIRAMLQKTMKPGSRIVSHLYHMRDWKPAKEETITMENGAEHGIYLWQIEKKK